MFEHACHEGNPGGEPVSDRLSILSSWLIA
jgi:hypothetical protein